MGPLDTLGLDARIGEARIKLGESELIGLAVRPPELSYGPGYTATKLEICRLAETLLERTLKSVPSPYAADLCAWAEQVASDEA